MYEFYLDACDAFLEGILMELDLDGNLTFKFGKSKLRFEEQSVCITSGDILDENGYVVDGSVYVNATFCSESF